MNPKDLEEIKIKSFRIPATKYSNGSRAIIFLLLSVIFNMYGSSIKNQSYPVISIIIFNILPGIFSIGFLYYFILWIIGLIKKRKKVFEVKSIDKESTDNKTPVTNKKEFGSKLEIILLKLNNFKYIIIFVLILSSFFYWYELRPVIIKKQCSWFTYTTQTPAIPAFKGVTKEDIEKNRIERKCNGNETGLDELLCSSLTEQPARPAIPAGPIEKVTRSASEIEYSECLKHNGIDK